MKKQLFSFARHLSDTLKYNFARVREGVVVERGVVTGRENSPNSGRIGVIADWSEEED